MTPSPASAPTDAQIGMDIGGSKTAAVVLDAQGNVEDSLVVPTAPGIENVLDTAAQLVVTLAERTGRSTRDFTSIGVGVPGQVERETGMLRNSYNIGIEELALGPILSERTGIPVLVDNDVTAAAIGAAHLLGLTGTVAYLNLGTGLAAGFVINGQPLRGAAGLAGEIGHLPISELRRACPCGQIGCLETAASGSALKTYWPAGGDHPGRVLISAIEAGDEGAKAALENLIEGAASAIRVLGLSLDPDPLVIGGGLRMIGAPLIDGIRGRLREWEAESPFFAQLQMSERLQVLPEDSEAAAVGAAISSAS